MHVRIFLNIVLCCNHRKRWVSPETLSILCSKLHIYPCELFVTDDFASGQPLEIKQNRCEKVLEEISTLITSYHSENSQ